MCVCLCVCVFFFLAEFLVEEFNLPSGNGRWKLQMGALESRDVFKQVFAFKEVLHFVTSQDHPCVHQMLAKKKVRSMCAMPRCR